MSLKNLLLKRQILFRKRKKRFCHFDEVPLEPLVDQLVFLRARNSLPLPTSVLTGTLLAQSGQTSVGGDIRNHFFFLRQWNSLLVYEEIQSFVKT